MKMINKFALLAFAGLALASCSKKDAASVKELDGEWKLTEGSAKETIKSYNSTTNSLSSTSTYDVKYDGTKASGTYTYTPVVGTSSSSIVDDKITISIKFDKKNGTYEKTTVITEKNTEKDESFYTSSDITKYDEIDVDIVEDITITTVETGDYSLNQKAGETKKGTKLSMSATKTTETEDIKRTFYNEGTTTVYTGNLYTNNYGSSNRKIYSASSTELTTYDHKTYNSASVWFIVESTKDNLIVTGNSSTSKETKEGAIVTYKSDSESEVEYTFSK